MRLKIQFVFTILLFCTAGTGFSHKGFAPVTRGERPPIEVAVVPPDAYSSGHLRLRFTPDFEKSLDTLRPEKAEDGLVVTGITALDALNRQTGVREFTATFGSSALKNQFEARRRHWGLHLWYDIAFDARADIPSLIEAYMDLPFVDFAEPHYLKEVYTDPNPILIDAETLRQHQTAALRSQGPVPNDPLFADQWHYINNGQTGGSPGADIRLPQAWTIEKGSSQVLVAIIDGGIDVSHPDLAPNIWEGVGYNFVADSPNLVPHDHGSHVAGTVAAVNNNGLGVSGVAGGWSEGQAGVRLMSLQVLNPGLFGASGGFDLAPVFAAENGAAISQNSWGYRNAGVYEQAALDAIDYFNTHGGGEVLDGGITIFAAGNSGSSGLYYPAYYSGAFSVAALNHNDMRAAYSTYGSWVDVAAPGGETTQVPEQGVLSTVNNNLYAYMQGTSMACPHVSGVAALVVSLLPGQLTADSLRQILRLATNAVDHLNPGFGGLLGSGRINALKALELAHPVKKPTGFTAELPHRHEALLSWDAHEDDLPVMLLASEQGIFGQPGAGDMPGSQIEGGGEVLYRGKGQYFRHILPEAGTPWQYRLYAWDASFDMFSVAVEAGLEESLYALRLPFTESFETGVFPAGWDTLSLAPGTGNGEPPRLSLSAQSLYPAAEPSEGSFMLRFNSHQARHGARAELVSRAFSTMGLSGLRLDFDWHHHAADATVNDHMQVLVSTDRQTWVSLATISRHGAATGWETKTLNLPALFAGKQEVYLALRFEARRSGSLSGGNMYLDRIRLYTATAQVYAQFEVSDSLLFTGQPVLFFSTSAGEPIESLAWNFGQGAVPANAEGPGPHSVFYTSTGYKAPSLVINDTHTVSHPGIIEVTENPFAAPQNLQLLLQVQHDVHLSWEMPEGVKNEDEPSPDGYHVYRNAKFYAHIPDGATLSFVDTEVPDGMYTYSIRARYGDARMESPPSNTRSARTSSTDPLYSVSLSTDPAETADLLGQGNFYSGDSVQITAFAHDAWKFLYWHDENGQYEDNPYVFLLEGDRALTAVLRERLPVMLSLTAGPGGTTDPPPGNYPLLEDDEISLRALPGEGFEFLHWLSGGMETYTDSLLWLTLTEDMEITAYFQEVVSVAETAAPGVRLFPNPARSSVQIEASAAIKRLKLLDTKGRTMWYHEAVSNAPGEDLYRVIIPGISDLPAGLYIVLIYTETATHSLKLMVEK